MQGGSMPDHYMTTTPEHILVTGTAGFIGAHLCRRLLAEGCRVTGLDNLNDYYDVALKQARLDWIGKSPAAGARFDFIKLDLADREGMAKLFEQHRFDAVVNLAAQAGVRHSIHHPLDFVDGNLVGFAHVLEGCRLSDVRHLVFASSSSVYGNNRKLPFSEQDSVDHPLSMYAATKKANELMAHAYAALYGLPATGLRFFTVYGPWGRPDMAPMLFTRKILAGEPIDVFNYGRYARDFTYIDDIIEGVFHVLRQPPSSAAGEQTQQGDPGTSTAPWRIYNIGHSQPVKLLDFIAALESALGKEARKNLLPPQPGEVDATWADVTELSNATGYSPTTSLEDGIGQFVDWYRDYHRVNG